MIPNDLSNAVLVKYTPENNHHTYTVNNTGKMGLHLIMHRSIRLMSYFGPLTPSLLVR